MATICTKTVYNDNDMRQFAGITNADLPVKREKNRHRHRHIGEVALNNTRGHSSKWKAENRARDIGKESVFLVSHDFSLHFRVHRELNKPITVKEMQDALRDIFGPMFEAML